MKKSRDSLPLNRLLQKMIRSSYVPPLGFQDCGLREIELGKFLMVPAQ
jgi:hypothetical protein